MKKVLTTFLWIISIYLGVLLSISVFVTHKEFHSFVFKAFLNINPSFVVSESNWHPIRPSILLSALKVENEIQKISADKIYVEFSLLNLLKGKIISRLSINEIIILEQGQTNQELDLFSLISSLRALEELNINNLKIELPGNENLLNLSIYSTFYKSRSKLNIYLRDRETNILEIGILPNANPNGEFIRGYIQTGKFKIDNNLVHYICKPCEFNAELKTSLNFTLFQEKLLSLKGDLELTPSQSQFGFNKISSSFQLKDNEDTAIQVSAVLNEDNKVKVPEFFINFSKTDYKLIFPVVNLSNNTLIDNILEEFGLKLGLDGSLKNLVINLDLNKEILKTSIQDLGIQHPSMRLEGLAGQLSIFKDKGEMFINAPMLKASYANSLDKNLVFYDFNSLLNFSFINKNFEINPSNFSAILDDQKIEGLVSFLPIPTKGAGDINLRVSTNKINDKTALSLFPNITNLSPIKEGIDLLIDCGSFEDLSLIYRGPIDGRHIDNSGSFVMRASGQDICLKVNGYKITSVDTDFSVNNFNINGKLKYGEFIGSKVKADFKTYKSGSNLFLDIEGTSDGPLSTLLDIFDYNQEDINSGGLYKSDFYYNSPIKRDFSLLDKNSRLEITAKIEKGLLSLPNLDFKAENIFSLLKYNSETGFEEGYFSLKINSIPLVFDLDLYGKTQDYSFFTSEKTIKIKNFVPINMRSSLSGSSATLIKIAIPSMLRGRDIKSSYLEFSSNLLGTEINLPDPFYKVSEDPLDLKFTFYPTFTGQYSRLQFRYGEIIRGKLNLFDKAAEGFIIAGKKKRSINIERGKISLVGNIDKLNLSLLSSFEQSTVSKSSDLEIKQLEINEVVLSSFSLPKTSLRSKNSNKFLEILVSNKNLSGSLYLPKNLNEVPIIDLDFINLSLSPLISGSSFLDVYNNLSTKLKFKTDSLILNSVDYGNWAFDLSSSSSSLILDKIEGKYGRWGLTKNEDNISRLNISKNGLGWKTLLESKIYSGSPEKAFKQIGIDPNFEMDTIFVETKVSWKSLPWEFDYRKVVGDISFAVEGLLLQNSEDLQAQNNMLRLVNIFNVTDSFEKVTNLDFRKLYKSGFSADSVNGRLSITKNSIQLNQPLIFKSGSSEFKWEGEITKNEKGNLDNLALEVTMTLPLRDYLPAYALLLGGPVTAGVVYIAGKAFERNLDKISSGSWSVRGTLQEPKTDFKGWFEDSVN